MNLKDTYDFKNYEKVFLNYDQRESDEKEFKINQDVKNFFLIRGLIQSLKIKEKDIKNEKILLSELFQEFYKNDVGKELKIGEEFKPGYLFLKLF